MLDINLIREHPELIRKDLEKRGDKEKIPWVEDIIQKDAEWRKLRGEADELRRKRNILTEEIKILKTKGQDASQKIEESKSLPEIKIAESQLHQLEEKINFYLMHIPNILLPDVPIGQDDTKNKVLRTKGKPKKKAFQLKPHGEFLQDSGLANFSGGAKAAGTGFYYLLNDLALLDQALVRYATDFLLKKNYTLVAPPLMLNKKSYEGVVDLADFENVMYKVENHDLYLIATSEHPLCAMFNNETIDEVLLPLKLCAATPCFRREIGKHGIDTRGLFRVHQFNKVEQFVFCKPEQSQKIHEELIKNAESLFSSLNLPYRVVSVCTGDIGTIAAKKYDIEVWMPREQAYKEVVSSSNCTSYQSVRSNIKVRRKDGTKYYPHTLNSTAIATSRAIRAIVENFQEKDGSITIPKKLRPYMFGKKKILPKTAKNPRNIPKSKLSKKSRGKKK